MIYLYTAPIKTGKTTALLNWVKDRKDVGGILAPDIDELRYIYRLRDRSMHDYQVKQAQLIDIPEPDILNICKFNFLRSSFELAKSIIKEDVQTNINYVVIDEVGKLELKDEGLQPIVAEVIDLCSRNQSDSNLIIVIRDTLLFDVVMHFDLEGYKVIELNEDRIFSIP